MTSVMVSFVEVIFHVEAQAAASALVRPQDHHHLPSPADDRLRVPPDGLGVGQCGVVGAPGLAPVQAAEEVEDLLPELVARGAVEEEVDGVVGVHEKFGDGLDELKLGHTLELLLREKVKMLASAQCLETRHHRQNMVKEVL